MRFVSMSFHLLSRNMQQRIWKKGWTSFTDVQDQAIPAITQGAGDVLIASETASGKTEAAFLPILSLVEGKAQDQLKVLYIAPLKALINDQFQRIEELCELSSIPVHRWHGDVAQSAKNRLVKKPAGILQITPESVESLFINRSQALRPLLVDLEFIVIDEIHAFLGTGRGTQLRSLLGRVLDYTVVRPRLVGLSATVGDYAYARRWMRPDAPDMVEAIVGADSGKTTRYCLLHMSRNETNELPVELFEDMRKLTSSLYSLIFCNSKATLEEICVFLNRLAEQEGAGTVYLPHHANLAPSEREHAERTVRESPTPKSLVCTSTMELGVDIGQIDQVLQVDATYSVASLKQRLGRSGRRSGTSRMFQLYSTSAPELLQAIAVTELFLQDWVEEPVDYSIPYDVLWHQIISICAECNGITFPDLHCRVDRIGVFSRIAPEKVQELVRHMVANDHLEYLPGRGELIVGVEGERVLRSQDFYAVFETPPEYTVLHKTLPIGTLPPAPVYQPGAAVILAGKLWVIQELDPKRLRMYVEPAVNAKAPVFPGLPALIHHRVRTAMAEAAQGNKQYPYLYGGGQDMLDSIRTEFRHLGVSGPHERVIVEHRGRTEIRAFAGDVVRHTVSLMLKAEGNLQVAPPDRFGWINVMGASPEKVVSVLERLKHAIYSPQDLVEMVQEAAQFSTKFSPYLPPWARREMHMATMIDVPAAQAFLHAVHWLSM